MGRVLGGFWEGVGSSLASLGALLNVFFQGCVAKRVQEAAKRPLGLDLDGFGKVLGRVWEAKMGQRSIFWYFFDMLFETSFWSNLFDF